MGKRLEIKHGDVYGRLTILKEVETHITPCGTKIRRVLVQCDCGSDPFEARLNDLRSGHTTSCGCVQREKAKESNKKYNTYDLTSEEYGIGYTQKGEEFYFDKEDYDLIKDYCWRIDNGYVVTNENNTNTGKRKEVSMHRLVMNAKDGMDIDHRFHVTNDNRKSQLRECRHSQNCMNRGITKRNTSGVLGVSWNKQNSKWLAQIYVNGKNVYLGSYINIEDAIQSRKEAEQLYFGEYSPNSKVVTNE